VYLYGSIVVESQWGGRVFLRLSLWLCKKPTGPSHARSLNERWVRCVPKQQREVVVGTVIRYELTELDLDAHEFVVRMAFSELPFGVLTLQLPAWIPGSYMIRDFARNITQISAHDATGPVVLSKLDKQTWEVPAFAEKLVVEYRVYAFDLSVRGAYVDWTRAYFNGACLFLAVKNLPEAVWELRIPRPADPVTHDWSVATTLPVVDVDDFGYGLYSGRGYARLIDCPVEMGKFERGRFLVGDTPHYFAVTDGGRFDIERLCRDMAPICAEHAGMFGRLPVDRYLFLTLATADGYGGLEHSDSTSLICKRTDLPARQMIKPDKAYRQFLGLCSHEYFHLWNVKRIRPARLAAADLGSECYTELLWAFEGITSYYDDLALVRSGVLSAEEYLDTLANTVTRVLRTPGRLRQSVAESSFDAWIKFYKQDENAPNAVVSYYVKGALVALGLDVTLRERSADSLSLDDLMRRLWERYGRTGIGVPERGIEVEAGELLGASLEAFFQQYVYGKEELPLTEWFGKLGIGYRVRGANNAEDVGGYQPAAPSNPLAPALGARIEPQPAGLRVTHVYSGGAARSAGLSAGDILVAVDGERVSVSNLGDLLNRAAGDAVEMHYFHRDRLSASMLPIMAPPDDTCDLWIIATESLDPKVRSRRNAWLKSNRVSSP